MRSVDLTTGALGALVGQLGSANQSVAGKEQALAGNRAIRRSGFDGEGGLSARMKAIKDVHKDMWSAVKDHNGDAFCALAGEFQRSAILLAMEWTNASVLANIAVLHGEDE